MQKPPRLRRVSSTVRVLASCSWLVLAAVGCSPSRATPGAGAAGAAGAVHDTTALERAASNSLKVATQLDVSSPSLTSGCAADTDCGADSYCDVTQSTCVPKRSNGESLPKDALHDGSCSLQSGALLCQSGACNAVKKSCAGPNGAPCGAAAMCTSDVCGQNNLCGIEEGGSCDSNSARLCQTNRCSSALDGGQSQQGQCIRADGGCARDADCGSDGYCDPAARSCRAKRATGASLPSDSLHEGLCTDALAARACQSGMCNASSHTCAAANGSSCDNGAMCVSGVCGDNRRCGLAVGEAGCTIPTQTQLCQSSHCAASGACVPALGCNVDADCAAEMFCNRRDHVCSAQLRDGLPLPRDGLHDGVCTAQLASVACTSGLCSPHADTCASATGAACVSSWQCVTGVCADNGKCGQQNGFGSCTDDAECQSGQCQRERARCVASEHGCSDDSACAPEQYCNLTQLRCVDDLADGTLIPSDAASHGKCTLEVARQVCSSGACSPTNDTCAKAGGSACSDASECAADLCSDGACGSADGTAGACTQDSAASVCQSGICQSQLSRCVAANKGCSADRECADGTYCDGRSLACVPRLAAGSLLRADGIHSSACSAEVAAAVCDTGACNAHSHACASLVGMRCSQPSDCASDACLDGECVSAAEAAGAYLLGGGGCSIAVLVASRAPDGRRATPLALLWLGWLGLCRREQQKRGSRATARRNQPGS